MWKKYYNYMAHTFYILIFISFIIFPIFWISSENKIKGRLQYRREIISSVSFVSSYVRCSHKEKFAKEKQRIYLIFQEMFTVSNRTHNYCLK